mmetsp:Transcript_10385/g.32854  ORF Transcript_10385/g.32854 Transcript_10385/m.32854 type:complete len:175 (-) Transcript_10385:147-671(-)
MYPVVGTDVVSLPRILGQMQAHGVRPLRKFLSPFELSYACRLSNVGDLGSIAWSELSPTQLRLVEFVGGRWAAKEALFKAAGLAQRQGGIRDSFALPPFPSIDVDAGLVYTLGHTTDKVTVSSTARRGTLPWVRSPLVVSIAHDASARIAVATAMGVHPGHPTPSATDQERTRN